MHRAPPFRLAASIAVLGLAALHCGAPSQPSDSSGEGVSTTQSGPIHPLASTSLCLDVANQSQTNGTAVDLWTCSGNANQQWTYDGTSLRVYGSKCLDVTGGSTTNGTKLQIWDCVAGSANQAWTRNGNTFQRTGKSECVDLTGGAAVNGTLIQAWSCSANDTNQEWTFDTSTTTSPDAGGGAATPDAGGAAAPDAATGSTGFVHPGVLDSKGQLDFVKAKIAAGTDPWKTAFNETKGSSYASLTYQASPVADVDCGPYSDPDIGCTAEKDDAVAAYTQALLWYFTGNATYANNAIAIMNAWATTLKEHTNSNAPLQSAWVAEVFPRAAEIIRYSGAGWSAADLASFEALLKNVYLPEVVNGSDSNGNWELSMAEATMNIAVFLDDKTSFDKALSLWRGRVPAYVYMTTDGSKPVAPPGGTSDIASFWYGQTTYMDGLAQETCRDLGHAQYGLAAMINAAETARIQGVDLFSEQAARIAAGMEFHANFLDGAAVPSTLCGGTLNAVSADAMWEIGYNALAGRLGMSLPHTATLITKIRPTWADHHMDWETLTHAEIGAVGVP
jgi:hypothetical protein